MPEASDEWRWHDLGEALVVLAAEPDVQLLWIGEAHPDELALNFADARVNALGSSSGTPLGISAGLLDLVETIDSELTAMSGPNHPELWTAQGIRDSEPWSLIRTLARRAVDLWPEPA